MHIMVSVHDDDFSTAGPKLSLEWFMAKLREKHELKESARPAPTAEENKEVCVCLQRGGSMDEQRN